MKPILTEENSQSTFMDKNHAFSSKPVLPALEYLSTSIKHQDKTPLTKQRNIKQDRRRQRALLFRHSVNALSTRNLCEQVASLNVSFNKCNILPKHFLTNFF